MSGKESAAEEIVELGVEIVNPGGRPDELEAAAKAWRSLKSETEKVFSTLDKQVKATVGHTWRGPAAEAFESHWNKCKSSVEKTTEHFEEAADGLDKAAKAIREVNSEIHDIYLEIGISIGISVGMSFLTLGVSAATGTARVAMLVERALDAAGKLGRMLRAVANAYRAFKDYHVATKLFAETVSGFAVNTATGTAGGVATSLISGKGPEWETNLAGGVAGATVGAGAGKLATALGGGDFVSGVAGGAVGGAGGDALDAYLTGKPMDSRQTAITAVTGGAAGGVGGAARGFDKGMTRLAQDIKFEEHTPAHHDANMDVAWGTVVPVAGGVAANDGKDGFDDVDKSAKEGQSGAQAGARGRKHTATDEVRDVFG
ncbi:WXG100 family type VII secretion target [Streptomyces kronopolitis]|uniref:WXG100 family type VII secretion target n=1 Tax=Streptomyces kronopolitis TaxID=1612435 RepID=UPI0020C0A1A4|nr:WXG100 family type VII secretion target [Streptomyces kronopolitis]MCL6297113.1 WXG100 family type VII secretion target [Streptomyces kronopolitis]